MLGEFFYPQMPTLGLFLFIAVIFIIIKDYWKYNRLLDSDYLLALLFAGFVYIARKGISFEWITNLGKRFFPDIQNPTPIILIILIFLIIISYNYYKKEKIRRSLF